MNTFDYILQKFNLNPGRRYDIEIPGDLGSRALADLFAELHFNKGVEVGVEKGIYSEVLCQANPKLHLYCIDAWRLSLYEDGFFADNIEQDHFENNYNETIKRLAPYNCTIIRKSSLEAAIDFRDESLDFVYLDAGHDFVNFTLDLHTWKEKVKKGGILSGHDYGRYQAFKMMHVKEVLMAYARSYQLVPYFVLPRARTNLKRDLDGSWFLVKK